MNENLLYHAIASAMEKAIAPLHARLNALIEAERKPVENPQPKADETPQEETYDFSRWSAIAKKRFGEKYHIY